LFTVEDTHHGSLVGATMAVLGDRQPVKEKTRKKKTQGGANTRPEYGSFASLHSHSTR
jgi:hypothetical protein